MEKVPSSLVFAFNIASVLFKVGRDFLVPMLAELLWYLVFGSLSFPASAQIPPVPFLQSLINLKGHAMLVWKL